MRQETKHRLLTISTQSLVAGGARCRFTPSNAPFRAEAEATRKARSGFNRRVDRLAELQFLEGPLGGKVLGVAAGGTAAHRLKASSVHFDLHHKGRLVGRPPL